MGWKKTNRNKNDDEVHYTGVKSLFAACESSDVRASQTAICSALPSEYR
jgi:hypothetical protein